MPVRSEKSRKPAPSDAQANTRRRKQGNGRDPLDLEPTTFRTDMRGLDYGFTKNFVGFVIREAQLAIMRDHYQIIGQDFRGARMGALVAINLNKGLRQKDLAQLLGIANSGVVALLDRFCDLGLVDRRAVPNDRRAYELVITAKGKAKVKELEEAVSEHDKRMTKFLTPKERTQLIDLLGRVAAAGEEPENADSGE